MNATTTKRTVDQFEAKNLRVGGKVRVVKGTRTGRHGVISAISAGFAYVTDSINRAEMIVAADEIQPATFAEF